MNLKKYLLLLFPVFFACVVAEATPNCLYFNGNDQYVRIANDPLKLSRYMTVEFWFNADSFIQGAGMIDNGTEAPGGVFTGYSVCTAAPDGIVIRIGNGIEEVSVALDSIAAGRWQHLAFTLDRFKNDDNIVVFLNGRAVKKADCLLRPEYPSSSDPYGFFIGKYRSGVRDVFYRGKIDALRIWSYVRSNEEIRRHATGKPDPDDTRLKGYYPFDQDSGDTLTDLSASENHGELVNMDGDAWTRSFAQLLTTEPSDVSFRRIVCSWDASPDYAAFTVDVSRDADFSASIPGFPLEDISTRYCILGDIDPGTYYYRVKGRHSDMKRYFLPWTAVRSVSTVTDAATPVELSLFTAEWEDPCAVLQWKTESQTENALFILQRREGNGPWTDIHRRRGGGTNNESRTYRYCDAGVLPGSTYRYRLKEISYSGTVGTLAECTLGIPVKTSAPPPRFLAGPVHPNPFNPRIRIDLRVMEENAMRLSVHTLKGDCVARIAEKTYLPGEHSVTWNAGQLPAGVYILRIQGERRSESHKILYVK